MKMFSLKIISIMIHRHEIVKHYSYENKESKISLTRNSAFPLYEGAYRTFCERIRRECRYNCVDTGCYGSLIAILSAVSPQCTATMHREKDGLLPHVLSANGGPPKTPC